mgnify:FL=1|jgi:transposase
MENKRIRKTYDRDFKVSVMKLILEKHQSVSKVSRDLGVSQNTLHLWKRSFLEDSRNCFPGNGKVTEHEAEVRRLKQELSLVKEERDILKKAVGIFSETRR